MLEEKLIDIVKTAVRDVLNERGVSTKDSLYIKTGILSKEFSIYPYICLYHILQRISWWLVGRLRVLKSVVVIGF